MGASLWTQVWLPLLIGLAIQIMVSALCVLCVRLRKFTMKQLERPPQITAAADRSRDQPHADVDVAAADANTVPDLEMGNGFGTGEVVGESVDQPLVNANAPTVEMVASNADEVVAEVVLEISSPTNSGIEVRASRI